jgi:hypothetical protein
MWHMNKNDTHVAGSCVLFTGVSKSADGRGRVNAETIAVRILIRY